MKTEQMKSQTASVADIRKRLREIEGSNDILQSLEEEESDLTKQISNIKDSGVLEKFDGDIKSLSKEISKLEIQISKATKDVELLTKDKSTLDQIAIYNKQKVHKQNECNQM